MILMSQAAVDIVLILLRSFFDVVRKSNKFGVSDLVWSFRKVHRTHEFARWAVSANQSENIHFTALPPVIVVPVNNINPS